MNETHNNPSLPVANMEQTTGNDELRANGLPTFNTPVRIHVHSIRRRLADIDGISAKAAIDGLVHAKILKNDSPKEVKEISYSQEKGKEEMTIITIDTIENLSNV